MPKTMVAELVEELKDNVDSLQSNDGSIIIEYIRTNVLEEILSKYVGEYIDLSEV